MNNVSIDEVLKRPLASVENGSIKNNSTSSISSKSATDNVDSENPVKPSGMSKDSVAIDDTSATDTATNHNIEDGDGSEAETVVMPGKELDTISSKKTIRHEGNSANSTSNGDGGQKPSSASSMPNGSSTKPSRSKGQQIQESASSTDNKKMDKNGLSNSSHNSPSPTSISSSHDKTQDQPQHNSRSRATSESTKSRQDNNDTHKASSATISRKRKVEMDGIEDKSAKRRIKREDNDTIASTDSRKHASSARSESPSRQRTSTGSSNSPNITKPRRKAPPPLVVGTGGRRKQSVDGDSNDSQSPKHSAQPKLAHATDSEMLKKRRDKNGRTRVARACAVNNLEEVREYLKDHPEELDEPDNAGNTPLQIASLEGSTDIVKLLLKKGCKVDTENCDRDSPLIDSVENSHLAVVRLLLEAGVNPRKLNAKGEEPSELVDMEHPDGPAIKEELARYRVKYDSKRRQSTEKGPDTGKESVSARSPRGSPSLNARSPPPQTTRRRAGRSEATRNDLLWITATPENLVNFAGKGDDQAIMHLLNMRPISDVEAVLAAAKGGHDSCLNLLLAMGTTNPDPPPIEDQKKGYNTPMLAAIGKGTPRIIGLLLDQPGFDPTKRLYKNLTYYEIAEKRQGDSWREEYRKLKTAYDEKMARDGKKGSSKNSRTSSPKDMKKSQKDRSPSAIAVRESSPSASRNGLTRKKLSSESKSERSREQDSESKSDRKHLKVPKRESREGSNATSDREASPMGDRDRRSASDQETVPKPRKRLVSGRDLKDAQIKQRRSSFVSTVSTSSAPESVKIKSSPDESTKSRRLEIEDQKDKKRSRRSVSPQPSETTKSSTSNTKRPRINSDSTSSKPTSGNAQVASMTRSAQASGSAPVAPMSSSGAEKKDSKSHAKAQSNASATKDKSAKAEPSEGLKSRIKDKSSKSETATIDSEKKKSKEPKSLETTSRPTQVQENSDGTTDIISANKIKSENDSPTKESIAEVEIKKVASRSISPTTSALIEQDMETAPTETSSIAEADKVDTSLAGTSDPSTNDTANEKKRLREQEEAAEEEELERRKRIKEDEDIARERAAQQQKAQQERQDYLQTLPRSLRRIMDDPVQARTFDKLQVWRLVYCNIGSEVDPDCPEAEREDLWITNFQAAALLVESDLEMAHYTEWTRKPLHGTVKELTWRAMRSMIHPWNSDDAVIPGLETSSESWFAELECERLWRALNSFWIRLSDFKKVVPQYPHLDKFKYEIRRVTTVSEHEARMKRLEENERKATYRSPFRNFGKHTTASNDSPKPAETASSEIKT